MIELQDVKLENMLAPSVTTVATNSTQVAYLDTIGWEYATILTLSPTAASTTAMAHVLRLTEGTNSAAATAIVAFTGGTSVVADSTGFVIPTFVTGEGRIVRMNVDLRKRERYLKLNVGPGTTTRPVVIGILSRGKQFPGSDGGSVGVDVTG